MSFTFPRELLEGLFIQVNVRVIVGSTSSSIKVIALSILLSQMAFELFLFKECSRKYWI